MQNTLTYAIPLPDPRSAGRLRVLDAIRRAGQIARIDIAHQTGLSPATVTTITSDLLQAGLITPIIADDRPTGLRRGRPREALKLRGEARLIAGLKVAKDVITVLLVDFEGQEIGSHEYKLPQSQFTGTGLCTEIIAAVSETCAQNGLAIEYLSGIGIGLAGQINGTTGFVHWSTSLSRRNVDLGVMLAERAPCPVFIENDANLVAKAEQLFGDGRGVRNFLVVTIEHGLGLGMVIDGQLYRGARGCGGEFGHTKVEPDGALCQCGQRGCLEAYAGAYALARANAAESDKARRLFAMGLANLVNVFDPELLILASRDGAAHPLCAATVLADVSQLVVQVDVPMPHIRVHGWGDLLWAKGAAAYGIEQVAALSVRDLGAIAQTAP
ncbi:ROK family transcriptional regulator [Yoonia sp.]|uniref:ROK family transcriptional regulator n=1 Tax=Yoonia sp. TaxID=2212373 RepID=UPI003F6D52A2